MPMRSKQRVTANGNGNQQAANIAAVAAAAEVVEISRIASEALRVRVVGTAPLIVHRFGEKSKRQMLDNMQGRKSPKQIKDPDAEYQASTYRFSDGGFGLPAVAFKQAIISAARFYGKDVRMTELRQCVFVRGPIGVDGQQLVRIEGDPEPREDVVRVGKGSADLRYRAMFPSWSTTLNIVYVRSALTRDSLLSLIDAAGMGVGVAEWRPERNGDFGTFQLDEDGIEVVQTP